MSHLLSRALVASGFALALTSSLVLGTGCATDAYCFEDCESQGAVGGSGGRVGGTGGRAGGISLNGGNGGTGGAGIMLGGSGSGGGGGGACIASTEVCDGKDNDCDGKIDNADFTKPANCGNCATNCFVGKDALQGTTTPVCTPPATAGMPGTCSYQQCASEYFDLDGKKSNGCEFHCTTKTSEDDKICNNRDDNCNNQVDEDVDFCLPASCGACSPCTTLNAETKCVKADAAKGTCKGNATCQIAKCKPGFVDANNSYADGCELPCTPSNGGKEICDGFDNDCNGSIDDLGKDDPKAGKECFGDGATVVVGECGAGTHAGAYACKAGKYTCEGPNVLLPNTAAEICDGKDNDCDGSVDESFPNGGAACGGVGNGQSLGLCKAGSLVCVNGKESCSGSIPPQEEACNGEDDDCDDVIDGTVVGAPVDCTADAKVCKAGETCQALSSTPSKRVCAKGATGVGTACNNTFQPPPAGLVSACKAGVLACQGGVPVCVGFIEAPPAGVDACGIDVNCDGVATPGSQPDLQKDVANCGECGKRCGFVNNVGQVCVAGKCENDPNPGNCGPGIISCNGASCNTACVKQSDQEICNNIDDDCDCRIDELAADTGDPKDIALPNAAATCASALGLEPECKSADAGNPLGVVVKCTAGKLVCEFKNGFCASGDCAATSDDCDGKDNNCNGVADEAFRNLGSQSLDTKCFSDDGKPFPGDGACRREGKFVCDTAKSTKCSVKNLPSKCGTGPDGNGKDCDELCDGVDNDCDGSIDEPKSAAGNNPTYYVKPAVVSLPGGKLIQAYEASRPEATDKSADSGNGYFTSAPAGETLDRTYACSEKDVVPWFLVTPREVEQSCRAIGGHICSTKEWQVACKSSTGSCKWGYDSACSTSSPTKCNLDVASDGDKSVATTGKDSATCFANHGGGGAVFDVTGNLREITRCQKDGTPCGTAAECGAGCCATTTSDAGGVTVCGMGAKRIPGSACTASNQCVDEPGRSDECRNNQAGAGVQFCGGKRGRGLACAGNAQCLANDCIDSVCGGADALQGATYPVMGGAFSSGDENGAACDFTFYQVGEAFKLYDTGFRCCFDADPR